MSDVEPSPHYRLRRLKAALLAVSFTLAGILLMMLNAWLAPMRLGDWQWLHALPLGELGGTLFGAGLLSTFFEYTFRRDQEAHTLARFRQIIREEAPAMRDAVVEGFAIHPDDLKCVATPELLDDIAANVMALRLGDEQFAREIYRDIRDQAIRAAERWYDVEARVRLSTAVERSTAGTPLLDVTVEWEYTTVPSGATRRFACVSDQDEYNELRQDVPATSTWFMAPRPGMDARRREAYELLELTVDGRPHHSPSVVVPVLPARPTASTWTKKPGAAGQFASARSSAPSPRSGATGCTSPLPSRHGVGHCAWTTRTPPLPKFRSVTPSRRHHPLVLLAYLMQYRARS